MIYLAQFNGGRSWTLSMPAQCVIALDGVIMYGEVNSDYIRRPISASLCLLILSISHYSTHLRLSLIDT
jgi:hypothetical protein